MYCRDVSRAPKITDLLIGDISAHNNGRSACELEDSEEADRHRPTDDREWYWLLPVSDERDVLAPKSTPDSNRRREETKRRQQRMGTEESVSDRVKGEERRREEEEKDHLL